MTPAELAAVRGDIEHFVEDILQSLPRRDQRAQAVRYLCGLLLDDPRKSIQPMAARLPDGNAQALDHFINHSPWDWRPIQRRLSERLSTALRPQAWGLDVIDLPKNGRASVGVHRYYSRSLGRVVNGQRAVSSHAVTRLGSCPIGWRLFLPSAWDSDARRRDAAHVPDRVHHRPVWQLQLDLLDELLAWRLEPPTVVTSVVGDSRPTLARNLEQRRLSYLVRLEAQAPTRTGGVLHQRHRPAPPSRGGFEACRVSAAELCLEACANEQAPTRWILVHRQPGEPEITESWVSNLPESTEPRQLIQLASLSRCMAHEQTRLRTRLGLDQFKGRSYMGWHHHVTLVSVAQAYLALRAGELRPSVA